MNRGTRGKATASIESQFVELVRKWVEMHPLRGDVLSVADIQVAAAKIMLKQGKRNWRLGANARLGAILLVLFVHEGLEVGGGGSGEGEPYILGVPMSEVYEMLECVISEAGLTKRVLLDNVGWVHTGIICRKAPAGDASPPLQGQARGRRADTGWSVCFARSAFMRGRGGVATEADIAEVQAGHEAGGVVRLLVLGRRSSLISCGPSRTKVLAERVEQARPNGRVLVFASYRP